MRRTQALKVVDFICDRNRLDRLWSYANSLNILLFKCVNLICELLAASFQLLLDRPLGPLNASLCLCDNLGHLPDHLLDLTDILLKLSGGPCPEHLT